MTTKIRYFNFSSFSSSDLKRLTASMADDSFAGARDRGFILDDVQQTNFRARYVQRNEFVQEILDPHGKKIEVPRIDYDEVPFSVHSAWPHIEIYDQFRLSGLVLNRIAGFFGYDRALTPLSLDFTAIFSHMRELDHAAYVESVLISDVALSTKSLAKLQIEGDEDVRKHIKEVVGTKNYKLLAIRLHWSSDNQTVKARFSESGKIEITGLPPKPALSAIRKIIRSSQILK